MNWLKKIGCLLFGLGAAMTSIAAPNHWKMNMPEGVTPISHMVYHLHMTIFLICCAIGVVVFGVLIYAIVKHRKSVGHKAATFHENATLEVIWTIIPFLILISMAWPATKVLIEMNDFEDSDMTVKVVGYQWKWQYEYLDEGIKFFSNLGTSWDQINNEKAKQRNYLLEVDNELVLPVNKRVRLLTTANDVIHSWWVPDLGFKRDALPGFINEAWVKIEKPGIYRGQCAELCGVNHAYMPIVVRAVPQAEYDSWVKKQQQKIAAEKEAASSAWTKDKLMSFGKAAYDKYCAACHKVDGSGQPPVFPAMKGSSIAVGKPISRHIDIVLNGRPGTAMQAFAGQLTDSEIAAIVTYERNAWGNNTGDVVQPSDVKAERKK